MAIGRGAKWMGAVIALGWAGLGLVQGGVARADEPLFGYLYTTDTLPKGKKEIELWSTLREGRSQGDFHVWQGRAEVSYGLTDRLQVSGYINLDYADVYHNTPTGETAPPEVYADYSVGPDERLKRGRLEGVSAEAVYRILSPYTAPVGLALYVEPTIGPRTREIESRLIAQKNFLDDKLVFAANLTVGQEWRYLLADPSADPASEEFNDHWDKETDVNFGVAGSYRFRPNWSAGLELLNEREFAGLNPFDPSARTNVAYYFGPNLHFGGERFFVTGTFLVQLRGAKDYANPAPGFVVNGISNADDFEKFRLRIKAGYYF